jgi:DNA-binding NarL/FixJ family response regulator
MKKTKKQTKKVNLFIVDNDEYYGLPVKHSLEKKFRKDIIINVFPDTESCLDGMKLSDKKTNMVLLDYSENKTLIKKNSSYVVDYIQKTSPATAIIMLSDKNHASRALKATANGTHVFIPKNEFAYEHIFSSVERCLHAARA